MSRHDGACIGIRGSSAHLRLISEEKERRGKEGKLEEKRGRVGGGLPFTHNQCATAQRLV
jgi:hypothetical protein